MIDTKGLSRPHVVFKGKKGLKLIKQILNTPPTDPVIHEQIIKSLREQEQRILKKRAEKALKEKHKVRKKEFKHDV